MDFRDIHALGVVRDKRGWRVKGIIEHLVLNIAEVSDTTDMRIFVVLSGKLSLDRTLSNYLTTDATGSLTRGLILVSVLSGLYSNLGERLL